MKRLYNRPVFIYLFTDMLKGMAVFFGIMVIIYAAFITGWLTITAKGFDGDMNLSAYGISCAITLFVVGISTIRENMRLMLQNGIGRKTMFFMQLAAAAAVSCIMAAAGELLTTAAQAIAGSSEKLIISDIFSVVTNNTGSMSFVQHLESILALFILFVSSYLWGAFLSLMFLRLNKMWTIVVAVGGPVFFTMILPITIEMISERFNLKLSPAVISFFAESSVQLIVSIIFIAAAALFNYLLIKRAPMKPVR